MAAKKPVKKAMSKRALQKTKGGAFDSFSQARPPGGTLHRSGPGDEGPEESVAFVYSKIQ